MSDINNQFDELQKHISHLIEHSKDWVNNEIDWIVDDVQVELNKAYQVLGGLS
ncbi:MAG: hypothetical protein IBX55_09950 [Methyloprofundus sp.]|nr:hypothetical protein [Methyloprofundus sp.]